VGAIGSGLEVLDDASMDAAMHEAALDLVRSGGGKAIALLKYARVAYGAAGGRGAELPTEEAEALLRELFNWTKATLVWRVPPGLAAKDKVKVLLILGYAAADCAPRGGAVTITGRDAAFEIVAEGARVLLNEEFTRALAGECADLKPKFAPAYMAGLLARDAGGGVDAAIEDGRVVMRATFAKTPALALAR
ncbi:MAG TPA: histidine phosphotransferase family protein, partial [Parvularculaceae bacterium]|nr:histidine phosphotransferase family protein [Parvularculaceae bacterium]